jgi:hypothetical protein
MSLSYDLRTRREDEDDALRDATRSRFVECVRNGNMRSTIHAPNQAVLAELRALAAQNSGVRRSTRAFVDANRRELMRSRS